ncbi:hypothetical protein GCM10025751_09810 [Haladaptatus pallidirubidus]|uniref:SpoVT-AbrB domain-containing protein n=2 Tax=Haladaptatus pallidirubidus TaxID=1008152 RepID=A0AAV3UDP8_9EURY
MSVKYPQIDDTVTFEPFPMTDEEILGTTKIAQRWRISLIKDVRELLEEQDVELEEGDRVMFVERDGEIFIKPTK